MVQPCRVYFQTHTESTDRDIFSTGQEKTDSKLTLAYRLPAITLRTTIIIIIKINIFVFLNVYLPLKHIKTLTIFGQKHDTSYWCHPPGTVMVSSLVRNMPSVWSCRMEKPRQRAEIAEIGM